MRDSSGGRVGREHLLPLPHFRPVLLSLPLVFLLLLQHGTGIVHDPLLLQFEGSLWIRDELIEKHRLLLLAEDLAEYSSEAHLEAVLQVQLRAPILRVTLSDSNSFPVHEGAMLAAQVSNQETPVFTVERYRNHELLIFFAG